MPINTWAAGQDALLGFLAERDAKKRLSEDRERRDRLDAESAADRQQMRKIQEGQLRSVDEDRDARRQLLEEQGRAKTEQTAAAQRQQQEIDAALQVFATTQDETERMRAAAVLDKYKVNPSAINALRNPKPTSKPVYGVDPRKGTVTQFGEVPVGAQVVSIPRPPAAGGGAKGPKDDPSLPQGVKRWVESISQRGASLEDARNELSQGWRQQVAVHPNADLGEAAAYLMKLYPVASDALSAPREPLGAAAAPPPTPAGTPPPATGGPDPAVAQQEQLQQRAAAELQKRGKAVTPEAIQYVIQQGLVK